MATGRRSSNSTAPNSLEYCDLEHSGPVSIFKSAKRPPAVSLATFCARFRRLVQDGMVSAANIDEALWLAADEFKHKYGTRKTTVELDGQKIDLLVYFESYSADSAIDYRNFWQRTRALKKKGQLDGDALRHALTLDAPTWRTFYGGGRHQSFVYLGDEYPEQTGKHFHGVAALLRTVGRYADRALIWSRLKAGWSLDDALAIPVAFASKRTGSIYRVTRRRTGAVYVGLTVTSVAQRWSFHLRRAAEGASSRLSVAIQEDGADGFDVEVLESGIEDPNLLPAREAFWVERLGALGKDGLNSAKPGGMGSAGGKAVEYKGETFRSIEEAVDVLGERLGIARHVVRTRLQQGTPLPAADKVRRHSDHPDAGSNLYRRWLGMRKRHRNAVASEWALDYDRFKADVSPVPSNMELVRKRDAEPWGPDNFEWVSTKAKIERTHGKALLFNGVRFPSLKAVAEAYGIGVSTLKNRITQQKMSIEQAVAVPLAVTSYKQSGQPIMVDGKTFRSKRQAILYISETRGLSEDQAKYRFSTGAY